MAIVDPLGVGIVPSQSLVLVTGASGFLGGHIVEVLIQQGYRVRCQYRRPILSDVLSTAKQHGAELVRLDLLTADDVSLRQLVDGAAYVINNAALVSDWGRMEDFLALNVHIPERLINIAKQVKVKRFVHISSIVVHGLQHAEQITEDEGPYGKLYNPYCISKLRGEGVILNTKGIETVVIRPGTIYGPRDTTTSYRIFNLIRLRLMVYFGTKSALVPLVYCTDVADAVARALTAPHAVGRAFNIVGGERVTWEEYLGMAAEQLGFPVPRIVIPKWLVFPIAWVLEGLFRLLHITSYAPAITTYRIRNILNSRYFDISNAEKLLGFRPRWNLHAGMAETVAHYLKNIGR